MLRHPRGSYVVNPLLPLEVATPENHSIHRRCHPYARKSAVLRVLSRMQLIFHATRPTSHGASRSVQAMSWSVKTRRAPSRHCRDARVSDPATTVMHDTEYTPPPTHPGPYIPRSVVHFDVCDGVSAVNQPFRSSINILRLFVHTKYACTRGVSIYITNTFRTTTRAET